MNKILALIACIVVSTITVSTFLMAEEATPNTKSIPVEAGNDAFGTIQEIITILENDPLVDWKTVNIEKLRLHLIEMEDMTVNIKVISQESLENGFLSVIEPTTDRSIESLNSVLNNHQAILLKEGDFKMETWFENGQYSIKVVTNQPDKVSKIQGLGYIGIMALGNHHQAHHLSMAKGGHPHH